MDAVKEGWGGFKDAATGDKGLGALGSGVGKYGTHAALLGLTMPLMGGPQGAGGPPGEDEEDEFNYRPYRMRPRNYTPNPNPLASSSEWRNFDPVNPGYAPVGGMAEGGEVSYFSDRAPIRIGRGGGGYGGYTPRIPSASSFANADGGLDMGTAMQYFSGANVPGIGSKGQIPNMPNLPNLPNTPSTPTPPATPPAMPPQARAPFAQMPQNSQPQQWGRPNTGGAAVNAMSTQSQSPANMQTSPYNLQQMYSSPYAQPGRGSFAQGGTVAMAPGGFVMDARATSEIGNGSSNAGMERLQQMGGVPITGPGDGVSDSIPASIGGGQPAAVARDEVYFPPEAVQALGGTEQLYSMMDQAHAARQNAQRGGNTQGKW